MPERVSPDPATLALLDPEGAFPARLAGDRAALAGLAGDLRAHAPNERDRRLAAIGTLAHRLAGAAGTFGHGRVSACALALEDRVAATKGAGSPAALATVEKSVAMLIRAIERALAATSASSAPAAGNSGSGQIEVR